MASSSSIRAVQISRFLSRSVSPWWWPPAAGLGCAPKPSACFRRRLRRRHLVRHLRGGAPDCLLFMEKAREKCTKYVFGTSWNPFTVHFTGWSGSPISSQKIFWLFLCPLIVGICGGRDDNNINDAKWIETPPLSLPRPNGSPCIDVARACSGRSAYPPGRAAEHVGPSRRIPDARSWPLGHGHPDAAQRGDGEHVVRWARRLLREKRCHSARAGASRCTMDKYNSRKDKARERESQLFSLLRISAAAEKAG